MHISMFLSMSMGTGSSRTAFIAAIAVLACLLGAEIAGICVLISKISRARRAKREYERRIEHEEQSSSYLDGFGAVALLTAIPQSIQLTFVVLLGAVVAMAVLFLVLLLIFRACGYDYLAPSRSKGKALLPEQPAPMPDAADELSAEEASFASMWEETDEAQSQDAYAEIPEEVAEDEAIEETAEETVIDEAFEAEPMPPAAFGEVSSAQPDAQQPYKVVERIVTETVKEIYKEVPTEPAAGSHDAVLEKLVDLLDYEIRSRRDDTETATTTVQANESVPTFASTSDDEDEDEDEDDVLDGDEERDDDTEDGDGEDRFTGNEKIIGFNEETGCYIVAHYRKSFEAKLIQSQPRIKQYYSALKNALLSYKGTKNRISWTADSFHNGRHPLAKINVKTRILEIYLALDPASLEGTVYRGRDVSDKKKYADTPFQYKVRTPRKFKWAMELVQRVCEEHGLSPIDIEPVDYEAMYPFEDTDTLVARKLIKEYIREEKPATSFELAPDHTPDVPDEDGSVIPANANFSWEFDNERMEAEEEENAAMEAMWDEPEDAETVEETVEEAVEAIAPIEVEEEAESDGAVVRETVRVTEMRYTERYYPNGESVFEEMLATSEPIEQSYEADPFVQTEEVFAEEDPEEIEDTGNLEETEALEEPEALEDTEEFEEIEEPEAPMQTVTVTRTVNPTVAKIDLCAIEAHYRDGETVNLATLKEKQLIIDSAETLRVRTEGNLTKALVVEANHFTVEAVSAIEDAGGSAALIW